MYFYFKDFEALVNEREIARILTRTTENPHKEHPWSDAYYYYIEFVFKDGVSFCTKPFEHYEALHFLDDIVRKIESKVPVINIELVINRTIKCDE